LRLYGDENVTNFFRRLTFSPDGGLLMTPAGWFEDPAVTPSKLDGSNGGTGREDVVPKKKEAEKEKEKEGDKTSCIYVYSRAAFAKPPVAVLPGHKKASVAVRFSPVLFELRHLNPSVPWEPKKIELDVGKEVEEVELSGLSSGGSVGERSSAPPPATPSVHTLPSPALSAVDHHPIPKAEEAAGTGPGGVFALPYRMMYAVATQDSVLVYDTQQTSPVCVMSKLHYDSFTDMSW
jgi:chromatin assembly factor 1 subunit B